MRYFTRGWASGDLPDEEYDRVRAAYWAHLEFIKPKLPDAMVTLATRVTLHDAIIEQSCWAPERRDLQIVLICSDRKDGCARARLRYFGALLGRERVEALRRAADSRETEVLYDEVDLLEAGLLCHRLLFWPNEEVTLDFERMELQLDPCADARVRLKPAFIQTRAGDEAETDSE